MSYGGTQMSSRISQCAQDGDFGIGERAPYISYFSASNRNEKTLKCTWIQHASSQRSNFVPI